MIRIRRPEKAPPTLRGRGAEARAALESAYDADPAAYDTGEARFDIDRDIYAADDVKQALIEMQRGKCAFCEAKVSHISFGDVEHFRPKGGWRQEPEDPLHRPGYYWLAYEWSNLLFACEICNRRHKRNSFPLIDSARRARRHRDDLGAEAPLLVDPSSEDEQDDPCRHITFHGPDPTPVAGSVRGRATIEALGLHRDELREHRMARLEELRRDKDVHRTFTMLLGQPGTLEAEVAAAVETCLKNTHDRLQKAARPETEYSAMARAFLASHEL